MRDGGSVIISIYRSCIETIIYKYLDSGDTGEGLWLTSLPPPLLLLSSSDGPVSTFIGLTGLVDAARSWPSATLSIHHHNSNVVTNNAYTHSRAAYLLINHMHTLQFLLLTAGSPAQPIHVLLPLTLSKQDLQITLTATEPGEIGLGYGQVAVR